MSQGEADLETLIKSMSPRLHPEVYVFLSLHHDDTVPKEREGRTFVLPRGTAETLGYHQYEYTCRMVTLEVHSSLAAVGFLAVILRHLADNDVSVNVASGFYHDHLFVQDGKEELVMELLRMLSESVTESSEDDTDQDEDEVSDESERGGNVPQHSTDDSSNPENEDVQNNHDVVVVFSESDNDG